MKNRANMVAAQWCLRTGVVVLLTFGLTEMGSDVPVTWLPRKPGLVILESKQPAHEVLAFNLRRDFGVEATLANRIVHAAREASSATRMPLTLLLAVMAVESGFKPSARNKSDQGLMQVNPEYHQQEIRALRSPDELIKIDTNVKVGARILRGYVAQEAGKIYPALRRYNGLGKANNYPERVLNTKRHFDRLLADAGRD